MRDLLLAERLNNGYDIYLRRVSTLSYAPDVYALYQNGRLVKDAPLFATINEARRYAKEVA